LLRECVVASGLAVLAESGQSWRCRDRCIGVFEGVTCACHAEQDAEGDGAAIGSGADRGVQDRFRARGKSAARPIEAGSVCGVHDPDRGAPRRRGWSGVAGEEPLDDLRRCACTHVVEGAMQCDALLIGDGLASAAVR
jgi:hypothetical protein